MAVTFIFEDKSTLKLDAAVSQRHEAGAEAASHPVEKGKDVSDHIRPLPLALSIEGIVSDVPILPQGEEPEAGRAASAYQKLMQARDRGQVVDVQTGLKVYKRMALTGLTVNRDAQTGHAFKFSASLVEIQTAEAKTTTVPKDAIGAGSTAKKTQAQAAPRVAKGRKPTQAANAQQQKKAVAVRQKSLLKQAIELLAGK